MWILDNVGDTFGGRRLWLKPGKRYLFGRTRSEAGQLVISDKTISRKHLTITVAPVVPGTGTDRNARSDVTIEDLSTKIGTLVNGKQIRGQQVSLSQDANEIKMGHLASLFRITWQPVLLNFSFTPKELRADPWSKLRDQLEPLDIKYSGDHDIENTTHIVAKKRNTARGLEALISGKYIVTDSFMSAMAAAAASPDASMHADADTGTSLLEQDFDSNWPNPLQHLPPRGDEPSDRPISAYGPDARRKDLFDGYTFVFYDAKQFKNLLLPITEGKGKAQLNHVVPGETQVDDFVRFVKEVAGEQSLGEFEDGSLGKGVVVVRYLPVTGDHIDWFTRFSKAVSLRLGQRLIDQREFLDAILAVEPGMLRRPLEEDPDETTVMSTNPAPMAMEVDGPDRAERAEREESVSAPVPATRKGRPRRGAASRFKGFDADMDSDTELAKIPTKTPVEEPAAEASHEEGMFMSQTSVQEDAPEPSARGRVTRSRKRPVVAEEEEEEGDVMQDIAPTAAAVKRRRVEAGDAPLPPRQTSVSAEGENAESEEESGVVVRGKARGAKGGKAATQAKTRGKKSEEENSILEHARKNREVAEKRAADERAQLAVLPDDGIDAEAVRRLTLVEEVAVRAPAAARTRENDIADGRWDPCWNGRRNYKKFRKQGEAVGRPVPRVIVTLEPVKTKEYGIGDDYWLEGDESSSWRQQQQQQEESSSLQSGQQRLQRQGSRGSRGSQGLASRTISGEPQRLQTTDRGQGMSSVSGSHPPEEDDVILDSEPENRQAAEAEAEAEVEAELEAEAEADEFGTVLSEAPEPPRRGGRPTLASAPSSQRTSARRAQVTMPTRSSQRGKTPTGTQSQPEQPAPTQTTTSTTTTTTATITGSSTTTRNKRGATAGSAAGSRASPAKRPRRGAAAAAATTIHDSDSDDGLQFKFRRKR